MKQDYEQMEFDTRKELDRAVEAMSLETITEITGMIASCGEAPTAVRNRHEAYGIAAEHYAKIASIAKSIKNDVATLLGTLADPNFPAVEATSSIVNSTSKGVAVMLIAAAEMKRTLDNLYIAETSAPDDPIGDLAAAAYGGDFQEADAADPDDEESE